MRAGGRRHRLTLNINRAPTTRALVSCQPPYRPHVSLTATKPRSDRLCFSFADFSERKSLKKMATYAQFKHVELYKIGHGKNRVPNAPKSCIGEIFNNDTTDGGSPVKNGNVRPRAVRDTPTRPRDTHSRLFGQVRNASVGVAPMVTDTIRSHIQFGEGETNGHSKNGSAHSTPSRGEGEAGEH